MHHRTIDELADEIREHLTPSRQWYVSPAKHAALIAELRSYGLDTVRAVRARAVHETGEGAIALLRACEAALGTMGA